MQHSGFINKTHHTITAPLICMLHLCMYLADSAEISTCFCSVLPYPKVLSIANQLYGRLKAHCLALLLFGIATRDSGSTAAANIGSIATAVAIATTTGAPATAAALCAAAIPLHLLLPL